MEQKKQGVITIGMFGTCGGSQWRQPFIKECVKKKIEFFNPQVPDWKDEYAAIEADHLVSDEIILFPITNETYAEGSLAETGYSIASALRANKERMFILYIDPTVNEQLTVADPERAKASKRARALCLAHLKKIQCPNVYLVNSMEEMQTVTFKLHTALQSIQEARQLCV